METFLDGRRRFSAKEKQHRQKKTSVAMKIVGEEGQRQPGTSCRCCGTYLNEPVLL
jgi:hypothetical protein